MSLAFKLKFITDSPGFLVNQANSLLKLGLFNTFKQNGYNITHEHWSLLRVLWEHKKLSQTKLSEKTQKDRANISRIIDLLQKNGYVTREADPNDRRKQNIVLTGEGKAAQKDLTPLALDFLENAFQGVTQKDFICFKTVLEKLIENLHD